jgi:hypothetical protein
MHQMPHTTATLLVGWTLSVTDCLHQRWMPRENVSTGARICSQRDNRLAVCSVRASSPVLAFAHLRSTFDNVVRLQEIVSGDVGDAGRVPRTIECELVADLVDSCVPGDTVTIVGEVRVSASEGSGKIGQTMHVLYLHANSITSPRGFGASPSSAATARTAAMDAGAATGESPVGRPASGDGGEPADLIELSLRDLYAIQSIQEEKHLFSLFVQSLCPAIYGNEIIKAGLVLCLFGGCARCVSLGLTRRHGKSLKIASGTGILVTRIGCPFAAIHTCSLSVILDWARANSSMLPQLYIRVASMFAATLPPLLVSLLRFSRIPTRATTLSKRERLFWLTRVSVMHLLLIMLTA